MSKFNDEIRAQVDAIDKEAWKKIKEIFKKNNVIIVNDKKWNKPDHIAFCTSNGDVDAYLKHVLVKINDAGPFDFYVSAEELEEFKTVTWPKIYAKWRKEDREPERQRIKAEIESLQKQLKKLED